ncbi:MAG: beta-galactosidase [Verrucomicrobiota bacterium]
MFLKHENDRGTVMALLVAGLLLVLAGGRVAAASHTFAIGETDFLLDGQRLQVRCGEVHFARVPREYWQHRLKMCKAMGLNTVCVYLFWNFHEARPGEFNWSGPADAAEFCRMAQAEGLWVLLRPGPYSCAEWEGGGLPWWLYKNDQMKIRTSDASFLEPARRYLKEVGRVLAPLQITKGGPLLMVQVENEYGWFGKDAAYLGQLRQALVESGFEVPLFACNPPSALPNGFRADLFQVVNFGSDPAGAFKALRKIQPKGPLMNGEFYPAWFDTWGQPHHKGDMGRYLRDLEYMLKNNMSFSIYMAHGGTSFGLWSGADRPFRPDTSSYDYEAPISEAGWVTDKFTRTREVMGRYLLPGESLPEPPPAYPVITVNRFRLESSAPVFDNLPVAIKDERARSFEKYDLGQGCALYRGTVPAGGPASLKVKELHDFGWVYLDGHLVDVMDRRRQKFAVQLPQRAKPGQLDILVEAMGRINFGQEAFDQKGIHGPVELIASGSPAVELTGWQVYPLPLDAAQLGRLKYQGGSAKGPAFWRGGFLVTTVGDTFLDVRSWGKGVLWVNGRCLGRFWNIGPTQTMYCPGAWLKPGQNEVVVLDLTEPAQPELAGLAQPILDQMRRELDFSNRARAQGQFKTEGLAPAIGGAFTTEIKMQEARFAQPVKGRYVCLESVNAHNGQPYAAVAELEILDANGQPLANTSLRVFWADSEESGAEDGSADNVLDGQPATMWHTEYSGAKPGHPHHLILDLGKSQSVTGIRYLPRSGDAKVGGRIKEYRVYVAEQSFGLNP